MPFLARLGGRRVTAAELDRLLRDCPTLFHMAERGAWPSIERHGLLSVSALLDLYGVAGESRVALEACRRPEAVPLAASGLPGAVLRDQKPMSDAALRRCLGGGMQPADWYRLLNGRVFFWLSRARVDRLAGARSYRGRGHDLLELDAAALVAAHRDRITLCPINSGATSRFPAPRGPDTLLPIDAYPYEHWRTRRSPTERVVELSVLHAVPDVARFVRRVSPMGADPSG